MEAKTNPFYELYDRLYASAAAGTAVITEDFRLKRAVEAFAPLAEKNKVFARLHDLCAGLFTSSNPSSLLTDCLALAEALAVTQGAVPSCAETQPADSSLRFTPHEIPYSSLNSMKTAISNARKGSLSSTDELEKYADDPRLVTEYLDMCDSNSESFGELSRIFEKKCGNALIEPLFAGIQMDNPKATGRQIEFAARIAGTALNDQYKAYAFDENAPAGVRIRAIEAMSLLPDNADLLIELYQTTKGKVNTAALEAIAMLNPPQAEPIFEKLAGKYKSAYAEAFARANYPACTKCAETLADKWIAETNFSYFPSEIAHMLCCKTGTLGILDRLAQKISGETIGNNFNPKRLRRILITNIVSSSEPEFTDMIEQLYKKYPDTVFFAKFISDLMHGRLDFAGYDSALIGRHLDEISDFLDRLHVENNSYWFHIAPEYQDWQLPDIRAFDRFPQKLADLITDAPIDPTGNSLIWCRSLLGILNDRAMPADLEMLKKTAVTFALRAAEQNPSHYGIQILAKYAAVPAGAVCRFILSTVKKLGRIGWLYEFPQYGIAKEVLISEYTNAVSLLNTEIKNGIVRDKAADDINKCIKALNQ